jgi:hypothetical protein
MFQFRKPESYLSISFEKIDLAGPASMQQVQIDVSDEARSRFASLIFAPIAGALINLSDTKWRLPTEK